jgi:vacuolar protein sorting-associated protein 18
MEEATKSADVIREEINAFKNKFAVVSGQDMCSLCGQQLMSRAFFLFPCTHRFHMDCLQAQVTPMLSTTQLSRLRELQVTQIIIQNSDFSIILLFFSAS